MRGESDGPGRRGRVWLAGAAALAVLLYVALFGLLLPWLLVRTPLVGGLSATQLQAATDLRGALLGLLAPLAALVAGLVAYRSLLETTRQNRDLLAVARRGQVTERFGRAVEQLGQRDPEQLGIRLGGVYALEQIALDSEELYWPVMEVLTAFLQRTSRGPDGPTDTPLWTEEEPRRERDRAPLRADLQAILTVLGRRPEERRRWEREHGHDLNLRFANLPGAYLAGGRLEDARLTGANLAGAHLRGAHLEGAHLGGAHLENAFLRAARLEGADLTGAHFGGAELAGAHLEGADLTGAEGLTPEQVAGACVDTTTRLPAEIRPAP